MYPEEYKLCYMQLGDRRLESGDWSSSKCMGHRQQLGPVMKPSCFKVVAWGGAETAFQRMTIKAQISLKKSWNV
jgi:hypothetical protein